MPSALPPAEAVDLFLEQLLGQDEALDAAYRAPAANGLPEIQVSPLQGGLLALLVQTTGASRVLEVGTLTGYSTIWMARSLVGPDPYLLSLEIDPVRAALARRHVEAAGLGEVVTITVGPAAESLAALVAERPAPFQLVFIDADKPSNPVYLEAALALTAPGSLIVVDNVVRGGAVADPDSTEPGVAGSRAVIEAVAAPPRLQATALQTVGRKGHDGFLVARVLDPLPLA